MSKSRCWVEISLENLRHNIEGLQKLLAGRSKIIAIAKSDCYGHGVNIIVPALMEMGIEDFAVAGFDEAMELRQLGVKGSVLILGYTEKENWQLAYENDLTMVVTDLANGLAMDKWAKENNLRLKVEVKVDTGMNRIGIAHDSSDETLKAIYGAANLKIMGTFSHLCRADMNGKENHDYTYLQKERFDSILNRVKALGYDYGRTHLCASSGIMNYPEFNYDFVRPGFIMYGYDVGEVNQPYKREPVLSWYTRVEMVKELDANEGISYGQIYHTSKPSKIASVTVGYADGYPRRLSNEGYVLLHGLRCPIVGRVCMDQMMIDVSELDDVKAEDVVTLIGKDGDEVISVDGLAKMANTIGDEIVCLLNQRVKRHCVK